MNENNKSFYPSDMFEFIHHPQYGCRDLKGLMPKIHLNLKAVFCCLDNNIYLTSYGQKKVHKEMPDLGGLTLQAVER
jgi:hypothetical protein